MSPRSNVTLPSCLCLHDDRWFVEASVRSFLPAGPVTALVSRTAWDGSPGEWERCAEAAERAGAEVLLGDWTSEAEHRTFGIEEMRRRDHAHFLFADGDEVIEPRLLEALAKVAATDLADLVRVRMDTYWKSPRYVIRPREGFSPALLLDARTTRHLHMRECSGERPLLLGPEHGVVHHLSYAGPDERIRRKIATWSHRDEVADGWFRRVWLGWDRDHAMRDLHPTHPAAYGFAERIEVPPVLSGVEDSLSPSPDPDPIGVWPTISVVIPLYGGEAEIAACLESLDACRDLLSEVLVVDDCSPDATPDLVGERFPWVRLLRNERNLGFAATSNRGFGESSSDVVLFLNSDTRVPRAGLIRLIEALMQSGTIAAAGPLTNESGHLQRINPTYTDPARLDLFARDFAWRDVDDADVPMLVGFCLACRRSALEELGEPPFDERFGRGLFEDNDLCYRLQRASYRLRLANRAYVHHEGSKSLHRAPEPPQALLQRNQTVFEAKWREDLESGYASHLPGQSAEPIRFDPHRSPDARRKRIERLAKEADISLCMIVRNEERVLGECLASARGVFAQTIVVDTGSTDRTRDIIREHGAELYDMEWPESFAGARNESLKHARGRWIFWLDADDTLPASTAEAVLEAAINAPGDVIGFVVPVQFVEGEIGGGTKVDHVKLFRRLPGVEFEGRIHEQVLPSLRAAMPEGRIARIPNVVVLHSGYDTSPEGQARKAVRDEQLLSLDLEERPNHPFVLFNLGMTAHYRAGHDEAAEWLRKSIAAAQPGESHVRKAYALRAVSLREAEGPEAAVACLDEGLSIVGPDPELLFQKGLTLSRMGRHAEAVDAYLAMPLEIDQWFTSLDAGILGFKRSHNLGECLTACGRRDEARIWFARALEANPRCAPSAEALVEDARERGDLTAAAQALEALLRAGGPTESWATRGAALHAAPGGDPAEFLRGAAREYPTAPGPAMALVRELLQRGLEEEAEPMLRGLEAAGVGEAAFFRGVGCTRRGDYRRALLHMTRAAQLQPEHAQTEQQIRALTEALAGAPPTVANTETLVGPHAGALGDARLRHSVVVVTHNSAATLEECLDAVVAELGEEDELIVVDNASREETLAIVHRYERAKVVRNQENVGYARAANAGILASEGRYVTLLNPDAILGPGALAGLASRIDAGYAAAGPVSDNVAEAQFAGHFLDEDDRPPLDRLGSRLAEIGRGATVPTPLLMGLCLTVSREVLDRHGLLDEGTELGADDLELSWRLRSLGYRLAVAADVFVRHYGGTSFSGLPDEERTGRSRASDAALLRKLERAYGEGAVPSSQAIWGTDVFRHALAR